MTPLPTPDKADTAFMILCTTLVLMMIVPGLALFYGGLVRAKTMLSVLVQVLAVAALGMVLWVLAGYSLAFGGSDNAVWGGLGKLGLLGVTADSSAATFSAGVVIPEMVFIAFQMAFAAISAALIVGGLAERVRFSALLAFTALWLLVVYAPIAHMVWDANGLIFGWGALDFAGGTVVHINAGVAALVGAVFCGQRIGYGREMLAPHSLPLTLTGAGLLWVGWIGFNAGSALEANAVAALALLNTLIAPASAVLVWAGLEAMLRGKASALGAASGMIAGLVAITPAAGTVGPLGALAMGGFGALSAYWGVTALKARFGYDDSLDAFGIHGVAGIAGALLTAIFSAPELGGTGAEGTSALAQLGVQAKAVAVTLLWSALGSAGLFWLVDRLIGLRVSPEDERQGLDLATHGERAYHL